jgi:hypothetical protein
MKYLNYLISSILIMFVPIHGILIAIGSSIILDTFTGIFKSVKLNGWSSIRSRKLSQVVSKMLLYEVCVLFLYMIDRFVLNEFIFKWLSVEYMFTKVCAILLIFVELTSIKENIQEAYNIKIWDMLKDAFLRAKEVKDNINEII